MQLQRNNKFLIIQCKAINQIIETLISSLPLIGQSCMYFGLADVAHFVVDFGSMKSTEANYIRSAMLKTLDFALLSHAHIDHYGNAEQLPRNIPVFMTPGSAKMIIAQDNKQNICQKLNIITKQFYCRFSPFPGIHVTFYPTGHFIGAAMVFIECKYGNYVYSGDFKVPGLRITKSLQNSNLYFSESSTIASYQDFPTTQLLYFQHMLVTIMRGKTALHPVASTGQGQELAVALRQGFQNVKSSKICEIVTGQMQSMTKMMEEAVQYAQDLNSGDLYYRSHFKDYAMFNSNRNLLLAAPQNIRTGVVLDVMFEQCQDPHSVLVIFGASAPGSLNWRFLSGCGRLINRDNAKRFLDLRTKIVSGQYKSHSDFRQWCRLNRFINPQQRYDIHYSEPELRDQAISLDFGLRYDTQQKQTNLFRIQLNCHAKSVFDAFLSKGIVLDEIEQKVFTCGSNFMVYQQEDKCFAVCRGCQIRKFLMKLALSLK